MTIPEFVQALKIQTSDAAIFGTIANLERPPGRKPRESDIRLSEWYTHLSASDRELVNATVQEAAELAVFSLLCVLDGVSAIENGPEKGELRLIYSRDGHDLLLNDPSHEFLHDSYNALCQSSEPIRSERSETQLYAVNSTQRLRSEQTFNDGMDLHSISLDTTDAPSHEAPAIALPKNEHRKL